MIFVPLVQHVTFSVSSYVYAILFGLSECGLVLHSVLYSDAVEMYAFASAFVGATSRTRGSSVARYDRDLRYAMFGKRTYNTPLPVSQGSIVLEGCRRKEIGRKKTQDRDAADKRSRPHTQARYQG